MTSLACTQVAVLQESARAFMHSMNSPLAVHTPTPRVLAMKPLESLTSEDVEDERERISKIRARLCTRLDATSTAGAAHSHGSQRREREVGRQKCLHTPRHPPVHTPP